MTRKDEYADLFSNVIVGRWSFSAFLDDGVYVFLAVMTSVLLGGDGFMLFLTTSSTGLSSLVSTVWAGLVSFVAAAPAHTEMMRLSPFYN